MSEFKFGDLVNHEEFGTGLVVQDESETQGYLVYVKFRRTGDTHAFSSHWKPDFKMNTNALTLISRHPYWAPFNINDKSTWPPFDHDAARPSYRLLVAMNGRTVVEVDYLGGLGFRICDGGNTVNVSRSVTHYLPLPTPPKEL